MVDEVGSAKRFPLVGGAEGVELVGGAEGVEVTHDAGRVGGAACGAGRRAGGGVETVGGMDGIDRATCTFF